jgi:hypothetical protein
MLSSEWIQSNPLRILRLSANATATEIHKAAADMRRAAKLRAVKLNADDVPSFGAVPRSESDIRAALGKLESPTERLRARLFWFHSSLRPGELSPETDTNENQSSPLKQAVVKHDQTLCRLYEALMNISDDSAITTWVSVLREWHQATSSDEYRRLNATLENLGAFEPPALPSEIADLQGEAMLLGAEPLVVRGRDAVAAGNFQSVRNTLIVLDALQDTGIWSTQAQGEIITPAIRKFVSACDDTRKRFSDRVIRTNDAAEQNKPVCHEEIRHFRGEVSPVFEELVSMLPADHEEIIGVREEVVKLLGDIANHCTWADEFILAEELLKEASRLGEGTIAVVKVERSLEDIQTAVQRERMYDGVSVAGLAALKHLHELCRAMREESRSQVIREPDASKKNYDICMSNLHIFRTEIVPALSKVSSELPVGHLLATQAQSETALSLNGIAADFTWADDFGIAEKLRDEALTLAQGTEAVEHIEEGLGKIRELARKERMYQELKPISSAPGLRTINTVGLRLYGHSDHDPETNSFATTHYFVALYLPIFPVGRYRVIQDGNGYRFLGKLPFRKFDRWHLGIAIGLVLVLFLVLNFSPSQGSSYIAPTAGSTSSTTTPSNDSSGLAATPIDASSSSTDSGTSENQTQLASIKSQIDSGRARMADFKVELDPVIDELTSLKNRMEPLDSELKSLDGRRKAGESIDIDDFNSKVETYNSLVARRRALFNTHSADLQTYEELEKQDSTLVDQYNALLKGKK